MNRHIGILARNSGNRTVVDIRFGIGAGYPQHRFKCKIGNDIVAGIPVENYIIPVIVLQLIMRQHYRIGKLGIICVSRIKFVNIGIVFFTRCYVRLVPNCIA